MRVGSDAWGWGMAFFVLFLHQNRDSSLFLSNKENVPSSATRIPFQKWFSPLAWGHSRKTGGCSKLLQVYFHCGTRSHYWWLRAKKATNGSYAKKTLMHESGHDQRDFWAVPVLDLNFGSETLMWPTLWCCIVPSGASFCWETSPLTCVSITVLQKYALNRLKFHITQLLLRFHMFPFAVASAGYFSLHNFKVNGGTAHVETRQSVRDWQARVWRTLLRLRRLSRGMRRKDGPLGAGESFMSGVRGPRVRNRFSRRF